MTLDDSGAARASFTVTNTSRRTLRGRLLTRPRGAAKPEWFTVVGEAVRDFAPNGAQQVVVELQVPPGTPPGSYSFRLDAVSEDDPDEDFTEGPSVAFDVTAAPPPPPPKKFSWWILIVVGAVVLLIIIGVVIWLLVRDTSVTVPRVLGEPRAVAESRLTDAGFTVEATFVPAADRESHDVVQSQDPAGDTKQPKKTEVTIGVGRMSTVPNVKGLTQAEAIAKLAEADLGVEVRNIGVADARQDGLVQSQDPAERTLQPPGTVVTIVVGVFQPSPVPCKTSRDSIESFTRLYVPPHTAGDKEFWGRGPRIGASVTLYSVGSHVDAEIQMSATETGGGDTEASGSDRFRIYTAPPATNVQHIIGSPVDQFPGYVDTDWELDTFERGIGGPVRRYEFYGDTSGNDVEEGEFGTSVKVTFNRIDLQLIEIGDCG